MLIEEIPETDRPREKLLRHGAAALSDAELLAIFLRTGRRGRGAIVLAKDLLKEKGSLRRIARCGAAELAKSVSGIGPAKAAELCAAVELGRRLAQTEEERPLMDSARAVYERYAAVMNTLDREQVIVALLDTRLRLLREETISVGSLNESVAHPREIFRPAMIHSAHAIVLIHNHPSGDATPSPSDRALTKRLREAAEIFLIKFMDHVIVGNSDGGRQPFFSFRETGHL